MIGKYLPSIEEISATIQNWSVSIIGINEDKYGHQLMALVGSGTFIKINSTFGILTAQHVLPLLSDNYESLGLLLIERRHCYKKPLQYFILKEIAIPNILEEGPDLGFIQIPIEIVREIKPYKSFFDLSSDCEYLLANPPPIKFGVWYVSGTPDEYSSRDLTIKIPAMKFRPFCWLCEVNEPYMKNDYDYIESTVYYDQGELLPNSFGGISGGGLWQVLVEKKSESELCPKRFLFSGIVFYQSKIEINRRIIKCHGRISIYKKIFEYFGVYPPNPRLQPTWPSARG
jgi:hypothetical protein